MRGELAGFIDLLLSNVGYSQSSISDAYQVPIWKHIEPVMQGPAIATTAGIIVILALTWLLARGPHGACGGRPPPPSPWLS